MCGRHLDASDSGGQSETSVGIADGQNMTHRISDFRSGDRLSLDINNRARQSAVSKRLSNPAHHAKK